MARNKKNTSGVGWGSIVATLGFCAIIVALGVGYVWYKDQNDLLGRQIKEREVHLADLERQNKIRRDQLATLCSPVALDARVKKLNLGLGPPAKSQVIWMVENAAAPTAAAPAEPRRVLAMTADTKN